MNPLIFFSIDQNTLLYFDALITNMIVNITDKIIFKVKYLKTIFFTFFHAFCVENHASFRRGEREGMRVASHGKSKPRATVQLWKSYVPLQREGEHEPKSNNSTCDYIKCKSLYLIVKMILSVIFMIIFV